VQPEGSGEIESRGIGVRRAREAVRRYSMPAGIEVQRDALGRSVGRQMNRRRIGW